MTQKISSLKVFNSFYLPLLMFFKCLPMVNFQSNSMDAKTTYKCETLRKHMFEKERKKAFIPRKFMWHSSHLRNHLEVSFKRYEDETPVGKFCTVKRAITHFSFYILPMFCILWSPIRPSKKNNTFTGQAKTLPHLFWVS